MIPAASVRMRLQASGASPFTFCPSAISTCQPAHSSGHLTTIVRRKAGRLVQEWITERRLAQARRLLAETDLTVTEVGHRVGYSDPVYFVRTFRRAHGTTPLQWRRAGRQ